MVALLIYIVSPVATTSDAIAMHVALVCMAGSRPWLPAVRAQATAASR
jgi:hypothetical protein